MLADKVPVPPSTPDSASLNTVSLPFSSSVAPLATLTVAVSARRSAAPRLSVPVLMLTVSAAEVPPSVTAPVLASVPAPRLASTAAPFCSV